jgi:hypothetical protein
MENAVIDVRAFCFFRGHGLVVMLHRGGVAKLYRGSGEEHLLRVVECMYSCLRGLMRRRMSHVFGKER